ncbi:metal ABC transporter permease [Thermosulfuriphilus sp.]
MDTSTLIELLSYTFVKKALVTGLFFSFTCALLGVFLLLRKDAMIGHGLSHIAFGGVAVALFWGWAPLPVTLVVASLAALVILGVRDRAGLYGDTVIGILSSLGMAAGIILASISRHFNVDLFGYLFGNILAISWAEMITAIVLSLLSLALIVLFYYELIYATFDEDCAQVAGLSVKRLDAMLAVLTAATVVVGMRVVGLLLVSALLVIPAATGLILGGSFARAIWISVASSSVSIVLGLVLAFWLDWPASGTIVLFSGVLFILAYLARLLGD